MQVFLNILILVLGMAFLIKGADFFVTGASAVAKKMKISPLFIGLTIVAIGTSLPELAVSITSAIQGSVDMSVGNVIGSNLANMLLIIGVVALITPITVQKSSKSFDFPFMVIVTGILLLFCSDKIINGAAENVITRAESIIFLLLLVFYIFSLVKSVKKEQSLSQEGNKVFEENLKIMCQEAKKNNKKTEETSAKKENFLKKIIRKMRELSEKDLKVWQIILFLVFGLAGVVLGGEAVSRTAKNLAIMAGMSEALVGLTIVAIGTSLPELVTSIVAARKGETDLAIGNIVGSNIINIVLILGTVGTIKQINVTDLILTDLLILFVSTIIFTFLALRKMRIGKISGIILIMMYAGYMAFAIVRNYCF